MSSERSVRRSPHPDAGIRDAVRLLPPVLLPDHAEVLDGVLDEVLCGARRRAGERAPGDLAEAVAALWAGYRSLGARPAGRSTVVADQDPVPAVAGTGLIPLRETLHPETPHPETLHLGALDALLAPFADGVEQEALDTAVADLLAGVARDLPGTAAWTDLGPGDSAIARAVLRAVPVLGVAAPVVALRVDAETPESLRRAAVLAAGALPPATVRIHLVDHPAVSAGLPWPYAVAPGHAYLPAGGAAVVAVLDLGVAARRFGERRRREVLAGTGSGVGRAGPDLDAFLDEVLPDLVAGAAAELSLAVEAMVDGPLPAGAEPPAREPDDPSRPVTGDRQRSVADARRRCVAVLGVDGVAEAVGTVLGQDPAGVGAAPGSGPVTVTGSGGVVDCAGYGVDAEAAEVAALLVHRLADLAAAVPPVGPRITGPPLLHAPFGSTGVRVPDLLEPPPYNHLRTLAAVQPAFAAGAADVLALDAGVRENPQAGVDVVRGAFACGVRGLALAVHAVPKVRVTGFLVRHGVVVKPDGPRWR